CSAADPAKRDLINNLIQTKEDIKMATEMLMEISQDERQRAIMRSRRMYETDRMSDLLNAKEEGEIEERRKIVENMYQEGFDVKTIAKATRLSEQDVNGILGL
ncbi:nuclease/transposase family protein, partial [Treponema sp. R8-4-B8]